MCTKLYFYFCILYSVFTTKNLVSVCHHTVDPFYPFCLPFPQVTTTLFSLYLCVYFYLVFSFILFVGAYIPHEGNHMVFVFLRLTYFTE